MLRTKGGENQPQQNVEASQKPDERKLLPLTARSQKSSARPEKHKELRGLLLKHGVAADRMERDPLAIYKINDVLIAGGLVTYQAEFTRTRGNLLAKNSTIHDQLGSGLLEFC